MLLVASLIFYAWGEPRFVPLLLFSAALNYAAGLCIAREWQTERCTPEGAPAYQVLKSPGLDPKARERVFFPLNEMRAIRGRDAMFPLTFFHWSGAGPRAVAGMTQERFWKRPAPGGTTIPLVEKRVPSDVEVVYVSTNGLAQATPR